MEPYENNEEHLKDQLLRLDLLIKVYLLHFDSLRLPDVNPDLRGLILTRGEIENTLEEGHNAAAAAGTEPLPDEQRSVVEALHNLENRIEKRIFLNWEAQAPPALERLCYLFQLTPFEKDMLLVCLAPEVDRKYDKLYAYLQDDVTRKRPSVDLILNLLCQTFEEKILGRTFFHPDAQLLRSQMLSFVSESQTASVPLLSRFVKLDDRVVDFVMHEGGNDSQLASFVRPVQKGLPLGEMLLPESVKLQLLRLIEKFIQLRDAGDPSPRLQCFFHGPYGSGKTEAARAVCDELDLPLLEVRLEELIRAELLVLPAVRRIIREGLLTRSALFFSGVDILLGDPEKFSTHHTLLLETVKGYPGLVFLSSQCPWTARPGEQIQFMTIELPVPDFTLRHKIWQTQLASSFSTVNNTVLSEVANQFTFTGGQIKDALAQAIHFNLLNGNGSGLSRSSLYHGCRSQCNQKLSELSRKISPQYTWSDIVLSQDCEAQLREICDQVRYRYQVFGEWGFERKLSLGKGLAVLFAGASGTGKTMAAEILANELQIDLYKIDLSCVVSKYIGETEKNLSKVFSEAEQSNAILFFDEADALFGKRSEVRDSHDRYANIEVNYLLQKVEEFDHGVVILASNVRGHIDDAFIRRLRYCVEFAFPDETHRLRIWEKVFPPEAPLAEDVDFDFMASRFQLSGGNIKNVALSSAFLAAKYSRSISMEHLILATKREFQKLGKICRKSDFGNYYDLVTGEG